MARQISQRRRGNNEGGKDETLFGIRALESGIEVEGVWVSRPNTPEGSRQSSVGSLALQHLHRTRSDVDVEKQPQLAYDRSVSKSTTASTRRASSTFDCATSAERLPSSHASRDSSPDATITKPPRSRHPPCSYSKYSSAPYTYRCSATVTAFEGLEAIHLASTSLHADGSGGSTSSSQGSDDNGSISAAAPRLLTGTSARDLPPRRPSVDLELLNNHRMSQAAETGQLTPRTRRTGDWSGPSAQVSAVSIPDQSDYFVNAMVTPLSELRSPVTPNSPKIDALPAAVRRSSMPEGVTPFSQFCQTAPPTPRPISSQASIQERSPQRPQSHAVSIYTSAPSSPIKTAPTPREPATTQTTSRPGSQPSLQPHRSSFDKRESQILRGHGSGFEILRPGSLNPPKPAEHPMQRQRAAPPISLHNNDYRPRSGSADSRKKLKKKRRLSIDSRTSDETDVSQKSRDSVWYDARH